MEVDSNTSSDVDEDQDRHDNRITTQNCNLSRSDIVSISRWRTTSNGSPSLRYHEKMKLKTRTFVKPRSHVGAISKRLKKLGQRLIGTSVFP